MEKNLTEISDVRGFSLKIDAITPQTKVVLKALASEPRLRILELLSNRLLNVSEIAEALKIPLSTATLHINVLEEAGLLRAELKPGERGLQKVCQRVYDTVVIELPTADKLPMQKIVTVSMPIGGYVDFQVTPTCGLLSADSIIGLVDDPRTFYEPEHSEAQLLWLHHGYVEYRFPNRLPPKMMPNSLWFSMEICSEAPMHHPDWPSDITLWVNGIEVGIWTSPADFGGQRGVLTPQWWDTRNTQYGLLKEWRINSEGSFIDGLKISEVKLKDLKIENSEFISMRIGVRPNAANVGGMNLFGRGFGNYPQDIVMRMRYN